MYRFHDLQCRLLQRLFRLLGRNGYRLRQTGYQVTASDVHGLILCQWETGTDLDLDVLRCALTDQQIVFLSHVTDNRLVKIISGDLDGSADNRSPQRNHGDVRGTAADIHDHVAAWS